MNYHPDDVTSWPVFKPLIIAHDVGRSRDRSTAVSAATRRTDDGCSELPRPKNCRRVCLACARQRAGGGRSPLQQQRADRRGPQQ